MASKDTKEYIGLNSCNNIPDILDSLKCSRPLLIAGSSFETYISDKKIFDLIDYRRFKDFTPNPKYHQALNALKMFKEGKCDSIISIGGGSAIDVAKCVKAFYGMDENKNYLEQSVIENNIPLITMPTTAGTGSESTHFSVIYYEGVKKSVAHRSLLSDYVILDPQFLRNLSLYQKKCTFMDALCHAIESWWCINSTEESIGYSQRALELLIDNYDNYFKSNSDEYNLRMLLASNISGKAINITKTTAPHAMSYKITSIYNIPHGHSCILCLPEVWRYMLIHMNHCQDIRGRDYLHKVFTDISKKLKATSIEDAIVRLEGLSQELNLKPIYCDDVDVIKLLADSVNIERLNNNPVSLSYDDLYYLYKDIMSNKNSNVLKVTA